MLEVRASNTTWFGGRVAPPAGCVWRGGRWVPLHRTTRSGLSVKCNEFVSDSVIGGTRRGWAPVLAVPPPLHSVPLCKVEELSVGDAV